jgi:CelD/BcsL family acetyltransferase involved in cellulose biosynthesis
MALLNLEERLETAARGMVRICGGRPRRDRALTFFGSISLFAARHTPSLMDAFIRWRINQLIREGMQVQLKST